MKSFHFNLILAALLLCLAPMPYGYFQLVRFVAMVALWNLLPQRLILIPSRESHGGRVDNRIFREQSLDVFRECVRRGDAVEPIGDVAQMGIEFVGCYLLVGYPLIWQTIRKVGLNHDVGIPKAGMVGTNVTNDCNAAKPVAHILELGNHETAADSFLCSTVVHVGIELGECSHRSHFECFPHRRHGRCVVFAEVFQNELVLRTIEFFFQVDEVALEHGAAISKCRIHKPKGSMSLREKADKTGTHCDLYLLNGSKNKHTQLFIKMIETDNLSEVRAWLENMIQLVILHQSPIASKTKIADSVKCRLGFCLVVDNKSTLFQNVYLLLESQQLLGIVHKRINKKWPALVRCIPCGREAVAGSIECKGTSFIRGDQMFWRKSA